MNDSIKQERFVVDDGPSIYIVLKNAYTSIIHLLNGLECMMKVMEIGQNTTDWVMKYTAPLFFSINELVIIYHTILMTKNAISALAFMTVFGSIVSFMIEVATMLGLYAILISNKEKFFSKVVDDSQDKRECCSSIVKY